MQTSLSIPLDAANAIIAAAIRIARGRNWRPISVVVLDRGGYLVAAEREDGSGILRFDMAFGKAWARLALGDAADGDDCAGVEAASHLQALAAASGGRYMPGRGMLIRDGGDRLLGALGITGERADRERLLGVQAIQHCGFRADPADGRRT